MQGRVDIGDATRRAAQLHASGSIDQAIAMCEGIARRSGRAWQPLLLLGLMRRERNELQAAEAVLVRAHRINPSHPDICYHLACVRADLGRTVQAQALFRRLVTRHPGNGSAHFRLALLCEAREQCEEAAEHYQRAATLNARAAEPLINLGNIRRTQGRREEAVRSFELALERDPTSALAHLSLGLTLAQDKSEDSRALRALDEACRLNPTDAKFHFLRAMFLNERRRFADARSAYECALRCKADYPEALNNLGVLHLHAKQSALAEQVLQRCVALDPSFAAGWSNLGNLRIRQERWSEARASFETALRATPGFIPALAGLGTVLNEAGALSEARRCYESVLKAEPDRVAILAALANVVQRQGDLDAAAGIYDRAIAASDCAALRIKKALMLSAVMRDDADIDSQRLRVETAIAQLREAGVHASEEDLLEYPDTGFFLAYHGRDDKALLSRISALMLEACPQLAYTSPHALEAPKAGPRVRIGFVSRYFHRHSVGLFFDPVIRDLAARDQFEVVLFAIGEKSDRLLRDTASACSKEIRIPVTSLSAARRLIERERIDLLVYPEIGMDPFTWLLSFARLARIQCVLQGHSNTTGVPSIDWYVSSSLIETAGGKDRYTERLALLPGLPMSLGAPPEVSGAGARARHGLPESVTLYFCPMKLQKIHPAMDEAFAGILQGDPEGMLVLVLDHANESWDKALRARLQQVLGKSYGRVRFVPWQSDLKDFLALLAACDVVLDSMHHGGATTSHLALASGKPVVTLPSDHARGRFLQAYYTLMEIHDCVATSRARYVEIALALGKDPARRAALATRIAARIDRLYDDRSVFDAYAELFVELVDAPGTEARLPSAYRPVSTTKAWCRRSGQRYEVIERTRTITVPAPVIFGSACSPVVSTADLPECHIAELAEVEAIGEEDLLLVAGGKEVVYDAAMRYVDARVDVAAGIAAHRCRDHLLLGSAPQGEDIDCGVHLLGRTTNNYYHWLLEYLPRLQALDGLPEYAEWPLLIDEKLHPNLLEGLRRICPGRKLVTLRSGRRHRVHRLLSIGARAWMPVDFRSGVKVFPDDILFAPEALSFLRRRLSVPAAQARRRLYLRRGMASYRRLLNEDEIEAIFLANGFEVVAPESMTLDEQIALFAQAEAIAGPTGAAMANMVFAPPRCRVLVLYYPNVPYFYFSTLAAGLGHELTYLLGDPVAGSHSIPYQLDFRLRPDLVRDALGGLVAAVQSGAAPGHDASRAPVKNAVGFLLHIPELFNHYREIWKHLTGTRVELINAGVDADRKRIDALAAEAGLSCLSVESCLQTARYRCLVSNHPVDPSGDPLIKRLAQINVRMMYALGKAGWNLQDWNRLYDAILCFGPYHREALAGITPAALIEVGYPRFDAFFRRCADRTEMLARYRCDSSKPTIVWLPTWKGLSSVPLHAASVAGLQDRFNVVVKLHPLAHDDGSDSEAILRGWGIGNVIADSSDNLPLYAMADYLLCDYGGPAFGGIYTDRRVLLLNVPGAESDPLTGPGSPDILIRQALANVDAAPAASLARVLTDDARWEEQRVVRRELRRALFAPYYGFSAKVAAGAIENIERLIALDGAP